MALPVEPVLVPSSIVDIQSRVYSHLTKSHPAGRSLSYATEDWRVENPERRRPEK